MNYYMRNRDRLLDKQIKYEREKYNKDLEFKLFKRYQSRLNNHFGYKKYKAEFLLGCSKEFFKKWILFALKDTGKNISMLDELDLHHVKSVNSSPKDLSLWCWMNILPITEKENLQRGDTRDKNEELIQQKRVIRFLGSLLLT